MRTIEIIEVCYRKKRIGRGSGLIIKLTQRRLLPNDFYEQWLSQNGVKPLTFGLGNRFGYRFVNDLRPDVANVLHPFQHHKIVITHTSFVVWWGPIEIICVRSRKGGPSPQRQKGISPAKIEIIAG